MQVPEKAYLCTRGTKKAEASAGCSPNKLVSSIDLFFRLLFAFSFGKGAADVISVAPRFWYVCEVRYRQSLLLHVVDHLHEALAERVGLVHGLRLAIDADDGLGVRLAQVYPARQLVRLTGISFTIIRNAKPHRGSVPV